MNVKVANKGASLSERQRGVGVELCKEVNPRSCWRMKYKETFVDISTQRIRHDKMLVVLSILAVVIWLFRYSLLFWYLVRFHPLARVML